MTSKATEADESLRRFVARFATVPPLSFFAILSSCYELPGTTQRCWRSAALIWLTQYKNQSEDTKTCAARMTVFEHVFYEECFERCWSSEQSMRKRTGTHSDSHPCVSLVRLCS